MAKKCLIATARKGVFIRNATHADIFDLLPLLGANLPFTYFRISQPIQPYLIQQGAKYVVESHKSTVKVLHTGLKRTTVETIYFGDVYDPKKKTKSLILFCAGIDELSYTVYLFDGYYPRKLTKVLNEILAI